MFRTLTYRGGRGRRGKGELHLLLRIFYIRFIRATFQCLSHITPLTHFIFTQTLGLFHMYYSVCSMWGVYSSSCVQTVVVVFFLSFFWGGELGRACTFNLSYFFSSSLQPTLFLQGCDSVVHPGILLPSHIWSLCLIYSYTGRNNIHSKISAQHKAHAPWALTEVQELRIQREWLLVLLDPQLHGSEQLIFLLWASVPSSGKWGDWEKGPRRNVLGLPFRLSDSKSAGPNRHEEGHPGMWAAPRCKSFRPMTQPQRVAM